jgi:hypothetical protein
MTHETASAIQRAAEGADIEISLHEDYSGRAMYGARTTGLAYKSLGDLLAAVAIAAGNGARITDREDFAEEMAEELRDARQDTMGLGSIIY